MYENLSIVYDKLMDVNYDTYMNIVGQELGDSKELLILDLGCGSGTMTTYLKKFGQVYGVDNSGQMLSIASSKVPDCKLFEMDLLEISNLGVQFDFILSAFDVFNYLLDFEQFKRGLNEVYSSLSDGGKFIFDLHTPKKVNDMIENQVFAYEDEELSYIWFAYETENELEVESELTFFLKDKSSLYRRLEQFHVQRTYEVEKVLEVIKDTGFKVKKYFCDFDLENRDYKNSDRIIFVLEK